MHRGKPARVHLTRDGFEAVADHIGSTLARDGRALTIVVPSTGAVYLHRRDVVEVPAEWIVGHYTTGARIEHIEADLLERERELRDLEVPHQPHIHRVYRGRTAA